MAKPATGILALVSRCDGTLTVQRDRLSGWPAHQAIPDLAIVLLPTLADRDVSISDPSIGHQRDRCLL